MITWSVHRPAVVWATSLVLLLAGGVSFTRLALATRTTVELPRLEVTASWPGASAELVETYLTSPIEAAIQGVRGVRKSSSESRETDARLTVELESDADVQIARLSILERLEMLRPEFPPGVIPPTVRNFVPQELEEEPLIRLTISGPYTPGTLQTIAEEQVEPRLSAVPGVAGIGVNGGTELGVSVSYDARRLRQLGVPPAALGSALTDARVVQSLGEQRFGSSEREVVLRDQPDAIEQLADLRIRGPGGRVFRIGDLATIRPEEDARGQFFRIDGQPAIALSISRLAGSDAIKTAAAIRAATVEVQPSLPVGVRLRIAADESEELARQLRDLLTRGALAFGAVLLVLAVALRDLRGVALVMASAILSIAGTALGLYVFDIPSNMLTLAGLAMGIGILVQNGLVVVLRLGAEPDTPVGRAAVGRRMAPAVVGSTLATAVVLFPFLYLQGNARAAFVPFAAAFVMALAWSVLAALVMIPALARGHGMHASRWMRARHGYARLLLVVTRYRRIAFAITIIALAVLTWGFVKKVPRFAWGGFGEQRTSIGVFLTFPRGSDPQSLDAAMRELERTVAGSPGVERVVAQSRGTAAAGMQVLFTRDGGLTAAPQDLEERLTQRAVLIGGASVSVRGSGPGFSSGLGSATMATFRIRVLGYSYAGVERMAYDLKERLERIPRVRDVDANAGSFFGSDKVFAVTLEPDRAALAHYGVTATELATAVAREVRGPVGRQLLEIGGDEVPVTVKASGARERTLEELRDAIVPAPSSSPVRIADLALVSERQSSGTISRDDQQYVRIVAYDFRGPTKLAQRTHDAFMKSISVPAGYSVADANFAFSTPDESERGLWLVFGIGVALVILSVAIVFNSVWAAWMVFVSLPLALAGVMAAFWVAGAAFTREAAVGVILVIGLAVHQAILLLDAALERRLHNRARGVAPSLDVAQSIRSAIDRSGMIVLVTLTSLASLLPLAIGTDADSLFGAIALATAGGTVAGTLGALVVMPVVLGGRLRKR